MRQLTQWRDEYQTFQAAGTEVICVFREEKEGAAGIEKSRNATKVTFPLVDDLGAKKTAAYQSYYAYLVDKEGVIRAVVPGTKTVRAAASTLIAEVRKLP